MNEKLTKRLNSFPKDYELSKETKIKIESALHEEMIRREKQKKWMNFQSVLKKCMVPISSLTVIAIVILLFISSEDINLFQTPNQSDEMTSVMGEQQLADDYEKMEELSMIWAHALKTRDGKPRYEIMSEQAKEKFVQGQIIRSGENWNYIIGESSPWVVDFEIEIDGMNAVITYETQTSEPAFYQTRETLTFIQEKGNIIVNDYQIVFENQPLTEQKEK